MADDTTKDEAREAVLSAYSELIAISDDAELIEAVDETLMSGVFEVAWAHQFDRDRKPFIREVRSLIAGAVAEAIPDAS